MREKALAALLEARRESDKLKETRQSMNLKLQQEHLAGAFANEHK